jgi:hypothetical protein
MVYYEDTEGFSMAQRDKHERPVFNPLKGRLATMEFNLEVRGQNHAGTTFKDVEQLWGEGVVGSLAELEEGLRDMGSRIYLIAAPLDTYRRRVSETQAPGQVLDVPTRYPEHYRPGEEPEYTLVIAVHGPEEASKILFNYGMSPEQNLERLAATGMLHAEG